MDSVIRDIRFGLTLIWKDRSFTLTVLVTLIVCIGANASIFTIVHSVLLKPLPVPESDRILLMANQYPNAGFEALSTNSAAPDYFDRLRDVKVFEEQAMYGGGGSTIEINGTAERVQGMNVTPSFFRLVRVPALLGRTFSEEEGETGKEQKIVLSYGLWQQLFAGKADVPGSEVRLSGRPFTVVGVMPRDFLFVDPEVRYWIPLPFTIRQKSDDSRHGNNWHNIGRLKPGATLQQAKQQVDALNAANLERFPQWKPLLLNAGYYTSVDPLQDTLVRDVRATLYLLWGGAAFVLLIGAVNITNLVLARSRARLPELATRIALGAARARITRQLITEGVMLTVGGSLGGLALAGLILRGLALIGMNRIPRANEVHIDLTVVLFTLAIGFVAGILVGLVPISQLFGANLNGILHAEGRSGTAGRSSRIVRRGLVVAQIGIAFVLLIGAGLLLASFRQLLRVDPGFRSTGVITSATAVPRAKYTDNSALITWMKSMLGAIRRVPGVASAAATTSIPFGDNHNDSVILAEGYVMKPGESLISPAQVTVTAGYFETMRIRLIRGRYFDERDTAESQATIIVDEKLANKFWRDGDPIGKRMFMPSNPNDLTRIDANTKFLTVVGVVGNVRQQDIAGDAVTAGTYYFPFEQKPFGSGVFAVKTSINPAAIIKSMRAEIAKIDPELPLFDVRTMTERADLSLLPRRTAMILALSFAGVALFLSAIGIYGVLTYLVTQRTKEIGIRIALGSSAGDVFQLMLREGTMLVLVGLALGLGGTIALRRAIENQIYGIRPLDPVVLSTVVVMLGLIALTACALPARRATRVDPVDVLKA
jgi:predicted permease